MKELLLEYAVENDENIRRAVSSKEKTFFHTSKKAQDTIFSTYQNAAPLQCGVAQVACQHLSFDRLELKI